MRALTLSDNQMAALGRLPLNDFFAVMDGLIASDMHRMAGRPKLTGPNHRVGSDGLTAFQRRAGMVPKA